MDFSVAVCAANMVKFKQSVINVEAKNGHIKLRK